MVRKSPNGNNAGSVPRKPRFNDVVFVNWSLTDDQKKTLKATPFNLADLDNALIGLTQGGYKLTVSFDTYRECYTASLVPQGENNPNKGYILTGKGSTPLKATKQVLYIHYEIMDGDWAAYSTGSAREEIDD